MVTSAKEVEVAQGAINTGAVLNFFHKPWSEPELIQAVQSAIEEYQRQCLLQRLNEQFTELEQSNYLLKLIDIFQRELSNNQIAMSSLLMTLTDSTLQSHLDNNAGTINCLEWAIYYNELIQCLSESMSLYIAIREHLFQPLQDTFNVETLFHQCQNQLPLENTALSLVLMDSTANCQITADLNTLVKSIRCLTLFLTTQHLLVNQLECKVIEDRGHRRVQLSLIPNQQHPLPEKAILSPTTKPIEAMSVDDFHGCSFMMYVTRLAIEEMNGSLDYVDYRFVILLPL